MPLLTQAELLLRYDGRRIGDCVLDDDQRATDTEWQGGGVPGQRVLTAIADAEGELISAVTVGSRYYAQDIDTVVTATPDCYSSRLVKRIVADLAYGNLLKRRGLPAEDFAALAPAYAEAQQKLTMLRMAERIFPDVPGVPEAGLPGTEGSIPDLTANAPPLISQIAFPYFGIINQPPYGPGRPRSPYYGGYY